MKFHVLGVGSLGTLVAHHLQRVLRLSRTHAATTAAVAAARSTPRSKGIGLSEEDDVAASGTGTDGGLAQAPSRSFAQKLRERARQGLQPPSLSLPASYAHPYLPPVDSSYVTLHLRQKAPRREIVRQGSREGYVDLAVEREGVKSVERSLRVEYTHSPGSMGGMLQGGKAVDGHDKEHIDALILTTKADVTIPALRPLVSRLSSRSTVVLLQNGLGVLDTIYERLFPLPEDRPHFILATTTHGAWRRGALASTHAAFGSLHFGIVPDQNADQHSWGYERWMDEQERLVLSSTPVGQYSRGGGWTPADTQEGLVSTDQTAFGTTDLLSLTSLPSPPNSTLRATVAALLSLPLDVHWEPIRSFQLRALRKLVINACINPLTALVGCRNGDLFGNISARNTMQLVCQEASAVLEAQARAGLEEQAGHASDTSLSSLDLLTSTGPDGTPALDGSLHPRVLLAEVERVASLTSRNWSSMAQDLGVHIDPTVPVSGPRAGVNATSQTGGVGRGSTEVAHINGYIASLGARYGIPTPVNTTLVHLINLKSSKGSGRVRSML